MHTSPFKVLGLFIRDCGLFYSPRFLSAFIKKQIRVYAPARFSFNLFRMNAPARVAREAPVPAPIHCGSFRDPANSGYSIRPAAKVECERQPSTGVFDSRHRAYPKQWLSLYLQLSIITLVANTN
jgi:hypothetical protein